MARAAITVSAISHLPSAGMVDLLAATAAADASGGFMFANDGQVWTLISNAGTAGSHVLSFQTPAAVQGLSVQDPVLSVAAGKIALVPPIDPAVYNQQSGSDAGKVYVDVDGTGTEIKVVAFRVGA